MNDNRSPSRIESFFMRWGDAMFIGSMVVLAVVILFNGCQCHVSINSVPTSQNVGNP